MDSEKGRASSTLCSLSSPGVNVDSFCKRVNEAVSDANVEGAVTFTDRRGGKAFDDALSISAPSGETRGADLWRET